MSVQNVPQELAIEGVPVNEWLQPRQLRQIGLMLFLQGERIFLLSSTGAPPCHVGDDASTEVPSLKILTTNQNLSVLLSWHPILFINYYAGDSIRDVRYIGHQSFSRSVLQGTWSKLVSKMENSPERIFQWGELNLVQDNFFEILCILYRIFHDECSEKLCEMITSSHFNYPTTHHEK